MTTTRTNMSKLNAADRVRAEELGQKIFDWTRRAEEHFVVLRTDPNAYAEAWQQYSAKAPPVGSIPPRSQYEDHISQGERLLEKECVTFYDHLEAANTLAYVARLQLTLVAELGWTTQLAVGEYVAAKNASHQYAPSYFQMPENPHPLLKELYGSSANMPPPSGVPTPSSSSISPPASSVPPAIEYPIVLPGQPFSWTDILDYPRAPMLPADVAEFKRNPEPLSGLTFTSTGDINCDMGDKAFRVSCFLTIGKEKLFYLVFADEGSDAVAYASSDFFTLLESSKRVITDNSE